MKLNRGHTINLWSRILALEVSNEVISDTGINNNQNLKNINNSDKTVNKKDISAVDKNGKCICKKYKQVHWVYLTM